MAITQNEIATQMVQQLRVLDPSISAEVGTPERKIIDTVAQSIAEATIDVAALDGSLDLEAKVGDAIDRFLNLFGGFTRQQALHATGTVEFSRNTPASFNITIPAGTQIATGLTNVDSLDRIVFATTVEVILSSNETLVAAPIRATTSGVQGNVAANTVNSFVGSPVLGITSVTNPTETTGGKSQESDDEFKVRFQNTAFRNVSGTTDQYLALAVSTPFTTKANVIGSISRYREYIQVPNVDDASLDDVNADGSLEAGNGSIGEYTTALSSIPYSKFVYDSVASFVSNGKLDLDVVFYTEGIDFRMNTNDATRDRGDTYRLRQTGLGLNVNSDSLTDHQPNIALLNVYTGTDASIDSVTPGAILLFEHSYLSDASRNDIDRNILNCVDIYVNGNQETQASAIIPKPSVGANAFKVLTGDRFDAIKFRRIGEPDHLPILGNVFSPLYWQPAIDLPDQIIAGNYTYFKNIHYWPIVDVSSQGGTVRSRNGIEWSISVKGKDPNDPSEGPYTGKRVTGLSDDDATALEIENYFFDRNVPDIQAATEGAKQTTTDPLVHQATTRYFKLDITVMYNPGVNTTDTNNEIHNAVQNWLDTNYFGTAIQLSDFLQRIHNVPGVDNVRWTQEVDSHVNKVVETDRFGNPRLGLVVDRVTIGRTGADPEGALAEIQQYYINGGPTGGTYKITQGVNSTAAIAYNADSTAVGTALAAATPGAISASVTGTGTQINPFRLTFAAAAQILITATSSLTGGDRVFNSDYFLKDNELPTLPEAAITGDTVPGLRIRPRAQHTWNRG